MPRRRNVLSSRGRLSRITVAITLIIRCESSAEFVSRRKREGTRPRKYRNAGNKTIRPRSESRCRRGRLARSQSGDSLFSSGLHAFCKRWPLTSFENRTATEGDCMCKCNCVSKVIVYGSIKLYPSDGGRTVVVAEGRTGGEKRRGVTKRHVVSWRNR